MSSRVLVAAPTELLRVDPDSGQVVRAVGLDDVRPVAVAADPFVADRAWCATSRAGVYRTEDRGASWVPAGLEGERLVSLAASPAQPDLLWAGAEPSAVWRSEDAGESWQRTANLTELPSSSEWSYPPRPDTHHVRWIACHPTDAARLWVAIEAGALIGTGDGGRSWTDRVPGGPYDTHELGVHPSAPDLLRSAAGDGYYESDDAGGTWTSPMGGLDVGYLRSVVVDPGDAAVVVVSAASHAHAAYVAGSSDGRLYRRENDGRWIRVTSGWPDSPNTIAPLLAAGREPGELWAADERGVHVSRDEGVHWEQIARFEPAPRHLRGLTICTD